MALGIIENLINELTKLPGIGRKSAQRLAFFILTMPEESAKAIAKAINDVKERARFCSRCFNITDSEICSICSDESRDRTRICVVEEPLDVLALEKNGKYPGVYHVLHGKIDPLNNIGPDEIYITQLLSRVKDNEPEIKEIILTTNPTMEGEATAMYIAKQLKASEGQAKVKITRIGRGLPIGADIEYADGMTLQKAMEGRSEY